eukprot:gb/GFBE01028220.1/.p1 GENE.gb/GFBE01028220.1/~~gb/GFBE01028220.1/.p1  ORF type:complete len:619 (+),score=155.13 gb/GFBE01028220.1/:1-1857(+)
MASSGEDTAAGIMETKVAEKVGQRQRMESRGLQSELQKIEESDDMIQEMLDRGQISTEEARRLRTRQRMHQQEDSQQAQKKMNAMAAANHMSSDQMLEEALRGKKKHWFVDWAWKAARLDKLQDALNREHRRRDHPDYEHRFPMVYLLVKTGMTFELIMFVFVAANGILTGIQISVKGTDRDLPIYQVLEETFTAIFLVEIVLRALADGWPWFFKLGNAIDVALIVGTGVVPSYILRPLMGIDSGEIRLGQAMRCFRIFRILKNVRTLSAFRILWSLVSGIVDSGRILIWTLTIIGVVLYMFSIFMVNYLVKSEHRWTFEQEYVVLVHFATVPEAMFTLFQVMTLDSWTGITRPLQGASPLFGVMAMVYVAVACMVLNNLVIAVIVNNAFLRVEEDEELQASIKRADLEAEMAELSTLFNEIDADGGGRLSKEEYNEALATNESLHNKLKLANLADDEIDNLWEFMDFAEEIDCAEFSKQIRNLKGECKAKHSYTVSMTIKKLDERIKQATAQIEKNKVFTEVIKQDVNQAQLELSRAAFEVRQFIIAAHRCIPSEPVPTTAKKIDAFGAEMSKKVQPLLSPLLSHPYERAPMKDQLKLGWSLPGEVSDGSQPAGKKA